MRNTGVLLSVAFLAVYLAGLAAADGNESNAYMLDPAAREELIAFVNEARDFVLEEGQDKALVVFNDPKGEFVRGALYIIAYDFNGTSLAHPYDPEMIGKNVLNMTDSNGVALKRNMRDMARAGGGFTYYIWPNPAHSMAEELKLTYVLKVDEELWLGAGVYLPGQAPIFSKGAREDLVAFVERAKDFALNNSRDVALKAFNDSDGIFVKRDLYIWAYDFNGTTLAHPFRPELVGKNNINLTDINGVPLVKNMIVIAERGKGFLYYVWPNPIHDNKEELKLAYIMKVNDSLWIGSGIYLDQPHLL
jgi:polar amino acid transport system substrate-binding protein